MNYTSKQIDLRRKLLDMYYKANAGHIACSLSCIDILITLFDLKSKEERVILSKGHAAAALYVTLNSVGEISDSELGTFYKNGTKLSAHPSANSFENIPFALGSLGHGLPISTGIAYANKLLNNNQYTYVVMSDGETNEGTTWEAAHFAVQHHLNNLIVIIDKNGLQGFDNTANVLGDTAAPEKWRAIGFEVIEEDGHDVVKLINTINKLKQNVLAKPIVIIAKTIKGKGVSYMENKLEWHYLPMSEEKYLLAKAELDRK